MLKKLILINYRCFGRLELDLTKKKDEAKKIAVIYGENGSGKTTIISAIHFLHNTLGTMLYQESIDDFVEKGQIEHIDKDIIMDFLRSRHFFLEDDIRANKMIGSNDNMIIEFYFNKHNKDAYYKVEFSDDRVVSEELRYVRDNNTVEYFKIANGYIKLNENVFSDTKYRDELIDKIKRFHGKHTFLAILNKEIRTNNLNYLRAKIFRKLIYIYQELRDLHVWCKYSNFEEGHLTKKRMLSELDEGIINENERAKLLRTEKALSIYFSSLCSDIKSVSYEVEVEKRKLKYRLYFNKIINGEERMIPYFRESTGTIKLLGIFPYLYGFAIGHTVCIDEIDSGVHDLLMTDIIESIKQQAKGQLIITTHNSHLMQSVSPDELYLIKTNDNGDKYVECVSEGRRIQKNNNVEKLYLERELGGAPNKANIDFEEIERVINSRLITN